MVLSLGKDVVRGAWGRLERLPWKPDCPECFFALSAKFRVEGAGIMGGRVREKLKMFCNVKETLHFLSSEFGERRGSWRVGEIEKITTEAGLLGVFFCAFSEVQD